MIICEPEGGLCNRLKCIISCLAKYNEIKLNWVIPTEGGGVRCTFNDLFQNDFSTGETHARIKSCEFIDEAMNTNNEGYKDKLNPTLKDRYLNTIARLIPVRYVMDRVDEENLRLPDDIVTVSVRTFGSFKREYIRWGQHFKLGRLFTLLDSFDNPILLTCDDQNTMLQIKKKYGERVYTTPKRTRFGDFTTVEGLQDALIDLYLGGLSKTIYGTHMSSFSEMQWWFGGCEADYVNMKLHEK